MARTTRAATAPPTTCESCPTRKARAIASTPAHVTSAAAPPAAPPRRCAAATHAMQRRPAPVTVASGYTGHHHRRHHLLRHRPRRHHLQHRPSRRHRRRHPRARCQCTSASPSDRWLALPLRSLLQRGAAREPLANGRQRTRVGRESRRARHWPASQLESRQRNLGRHQRSSLAHIQMSHRSRRRRSAVPREAVGLTAKAAHRWRAPA